MLCSALFWMVACVVWAAWVTLLNQNAMNADGIGPMSVFWVFWWPEQDAPSRQGDIGFAAYNAGEI